MFVNYSVGPAAEFKYISPDLYFTELSLFSMNVSIEQYRVAIGLHNRVRIKNRQTLQANHQENFIFSLQRKS